MSTTIDLSAIVNATKAAREALEPYLANKTQSNAPVTDELRNLMELYALLQHYEPAIRDRCRTPNFDAALDDGDGSST